MATFEIRRNAAGKATAIRVKLRRAGRPHLSHTVPIDGESSAALRTARAAAEAWVQEVEAPNLALTAGRGALGAAWDLATGAAPPTASALANDASRPAWLRADPLPERIWQLAWRAAATAEERALVALAVGSAMTPDALAQLRWQHVRLDKRLIEVRSLAGSLSRQLPLAPQALDSLLAMGSRKRGLVFGQSAEAIYHCLAGIAAAAGVEVPTLYRGAAWRLVRQGHSPEAIAHYMGLTDLSALEPAAPALTQPGLEP